MDSLKKLDIENRRKYVMLITRRLIVSTGIALLIIGGIFAVPFFLENTRIMVSWLCLMCGIVGGFVSIQQRLKNISDNELLLLSGSWFQILLIPIYGGVFAFVLYLIFLSNLLSGSLFPVFYIPPKLENQLPWQYLPTFLKETVPNSGQDFAKLLFWCFVSGFSERFVPQIITEINNKAISTGSNND